jgi:hypothetical protein
MNREPETLRLMSRDNTRPLHWLAIRLALGGALAACQGPSEIEVGPVCPECGPSSGGETGDFGPSLFDCDPYLMPAHLELAEADGLDVAEFERRLAQPIDLPMRWTPVDEGLEEGRRRKLPTRGYDEHTRVEAMISITSPLRYQRLDQMRCVNESCPCGHLVTADVSVEVRTLDGAVQATAHGTAIQWLAPKSIFVRDPYFVYFNARADLRDVTGTLRFSPPGSAFHGSLAFGAALEQDNSHGTLSILLALAQEHAEEWTASWFEGEHVLPVYGVFPAAQPVTLRR